MKFFVNSVTQYFSPELINSGKRILKFLVVYTVLFIILALGLKYAIPFVIALLIAMSLRPIKNKILSINKKLKRFKISEGFVSLILTITIVAVTALVLLFVGIKIAEQLKNFYIFITDANTLNSILDTANIEITSILDSLDNVSPDIMNKINEGMAKIISIITSMAGIFVKNLLNVLVSIPTAFIMVIITIIATFFFTKDIDKIQVKIRSAFSEKGLEVIRRIRKKKNDIFGGYIKAFSIIMVIIFIYTSVVYKIADIKYAIVVALITAFLDALPLFGAGLVYGVVGISSLVSGDYKGTIIILVGYIGCVFIRQFLEQKLMSTFLGLHPLVIVTALFIALTPVGFLGMFYFLGAFLLYEAISPPKAR